MLWSFTMEQKDLHPGAKEKMLKEVRIFLDEERENKKSHN